MPPEVENDSTIAAQSGDATPSSDAQNETSEENAALDSGEEAHSESASDSQEGNDVETAEVPPELAETKKNLLRDYHAKLARLKDEREQLKTEFVSTKKDSDTLQKLFQQEWFKKALEAEKSKKAGAALSYDLTDEQFDAARTDKRAFLELAKQIAENVVEAKYGDKLSHLHQTTESLQYEREFEKTAEKYGSEFRKLNDDGALDPYLQKGFDYETAFAKARLAALSKGGNGTDGAVKKEAERLLLSRKQHTVEKNGVGRPTGTRVVKAKNLGEALSRSLEELLAGNKDFKLSKE